MVQNGQKDPYNKSPYYIHKTLQNNTLKGFWLVLCLLLMVGGTIVRKRLESIGVPGAIELHETIVTLHAICLVLVPNLLLVYQQLLLLLHVRHLHVRWGRYTK